MYRVGEFVSRRNSEQEKKRDTGGKSRSLNEMLMTEKGSLTKEGTNEESDEHTIATDNNTVPLDELLANSTVPTNAVAIKVCDDSADEAGRDNNEKQKRGILSNFQRRTFSRISFKGETGPLLSRSFSIFLFYLSLIR